MSRGAVAVVLAVVFAWACAPSGTSPSSVSSPTPSGPLGAAGCRPTSPSGAFSEEIYGTATGGTVWAWFMAGYPPKAGVEDKTVWRLSGPNLSGAPTFVLVGPASQPGHLNWGPEEHSGSTWTRPGREFGTGLVFPAVGCWDIQVTLGQLTGHVYVVVGSAKAPPLPA